MNPDTKKGFFNILAMSEQFSLPSNIKQQIDSFQHNVIFSCKNLHKDLNWHMGIYYMYNTCW